MSGRVIGGQRAAIPSEPSKQQGNLCHTRHPRVIETLRQPRNHPQQKRKEGDLVIGLQRSAIGTLVERTTRFTMLIHLPREEGYGVIPRTKNGPALAGYGAVTMADALAKTITTLPRQLRRSVTWDRGKELSDHARFTIDTGVKVHFADPKSP
jgi:IS30 family transposase